MAITQLEARIKALETLTAHQTNQIEAVEQHMRDAAKRFMELAQLVEVKLGEIEAAQAQ